MPDFPLAWTGEAARLLGAGLLGAAATPLVSVIVERFPVESRGWWRRAGLQVLGCVVLAGALIVVSCLAADLMLASERRP